MLVRSVDLSEDYRTKMLLLRNIEEDGVVRAMSGAKQDVSQIPTTRYQWLKSITDIFNGESGSSSDKSDHGDRKPYIVVFKNSSGVDQLRGICARYGIFLKGSDGSQRVSRGCAEMLHFPRGLRLLLPGPAQKAADVLRGLCGLCGEGQGCVQGRVAAARKIPGLLLGQAPQRN